ncbi:hypothetical protein ACO0QE_002097 [Hanseniaspora vineae]
MSVSQKDTVLGDGSISIPLQVTFADAKNEEHNKTHNTEHAGSAEKQTESRKSSIVSSGSVSNVSIKDEKNNIADIESLEHSINDMNFKRPSTPNQEVSTKRKPTLQIQEPQVKPHCKNQANTETGKNQRLENLLDSIDIPTYINYLLNPQQFKVYKKRKLLNLKRPLILVQELNANMNVCPTPKSNGTVTPMSGTFSDSGSSKKKAASNADCPNALWCLEFSKDGLYMATGGKNGVCTVWKVFSSALERLQAKNGELGSNEPQYTGLTQRKDSTSTESLPSMYSFHSSSPSPESAEDPKDKNSSTKDGKRKDSTLSGAYSPIFIPQPFRIYEAHTADILDIDWSKNNFLLTASQDRLVKLWHVDKRESLKQYLHPDFVTGVKFHPADDRFFISGCLDHYVRFFSILDDEVRYEFDCNDLVTCLECSPGDGKYTVVGTFNGYILVFLTDELTLLACLHVSKHEDLEVIKCEENLDPAMKPSNAGGRIIDHISPGPKITSVQFFKDQNGILKLIISSNDCKVRVFDFAERKTVEILKGIKEKFVQLKATASINNEGNAFVIASNEDQWLHGWAIQTSNLMKARNTAKTSTNDQRSLLYSGKTKSGSLSSSASSQSDTNDSLNSKHEEPGLVKKLFNVITNKKQTNKTVKGLPSKNYTLNKNHGHLPGLQTATSAHIFGNQLYKNSTMMSFHAHKRPITCATIVPKATENTLSLSNDFLYEVSEIYGLQMENYLEQEEKPKLKTRLHSSSSATSLNTVAASQTTSLNSSDNNENLEYGVFSPITAGAIVVSADCNGKIRVFRKDLPDAIRKDVLNALIMRQHKNENACAGPSPEPLQVQCPSQTLSPDRCLLMPNGSQKPSRKNTLKRLTSISSRVNKNSSTSLHTLMDSVNPANHPNTKLLPKMPATPINYPVKPVDTFIGSSVKTLEASPSDTLITMKYDFNKKFKIAKDTSDKKEHYKTSVEFQTSNNALDLHYKFSTNKIKELSRVLSALGPNGVSMNPVTSKVLKKKDFVKTTSKVNKKKLSSYLKSLGKTSKKPIKYTIKHDALLKLPGAGTLLANTEIKKYVEKKPLAVSGGENTKSKKKSKSKSKKR